jgi:hypothetical protein
MTTEDWRDVLLAISATALILSMFVGLVGAGLDSLFGLRR